MPSSWRVKLGLLAAMAANGLVAPFMGWLLDWSAPWIFWAWYLTWCLLGGAWGWVQHRAVADRLISAEWSAVLAVFYTFGPIVPYLPFSWSTTGLVFSALTAVASFFQALIVEENRRARAEEARIGRQEQLTSLRRRSTAKEREEIQRTPVTSIDLDEELKMARSWRRAAMAKYADADR